MLRIKGGQHPKFTRPFCYAAPPLQVSFKNGVCLFLLRRKKNKHSVAVQKIRRGKDGLRSSPQGGVKAQSGDTGSRKDLNKYFRRGEGKNLLSFGAKAPEDQSSLDLGGK